MNNQKRLGQYFLINKGELRKIVEALDLKAGDTVIEIGPGHGELTEELRIQNLEFRVIAVEKDKKLAKSLKEKFANDENIKIIEADILKILSQIPKSYILNPKSYKVVGNIPYYITGYLLRILGELENKPSLIVLTIQKEVAERICGASQTYADKTRTNAEKKGKMNLLAASVQFWAEPEIVDYVLKTDFQPQPKVDSAIIKLKSITVAMRPHESCYKIGAEEYYKLIKILFKQPRKTILNNLLFSIKEQAASSKTKEKIIKILEELKVNPSDRPQNLSIDQIKILAKKLKIN